jgi:hypothetical protein
MTTPSPDPQPDETTGLDAGGSMQPGDTPPAEASTPGATDQQPPLPSSGANKFAYGAIIAVALVVAVMLAAYAITAF